MSSYDVARCAERTGWAVETRYRVDVYGREFVAYRQGDQTIAVEYGHQGGVLYCARYADAGRKLLSHLTGRSAGKTDAILRWMQQ